MARPKNLKRRAILQKLYLTVEPELLAERLGLKQRSLVELARRYGAERKIKRKPWLPGEKQKVLEDRPIFELATELQRSRSSVIQMRSLLRNSHKWSKYAKKAPEQTTK